ncbi:hypothetical protein PUN28_005186 [Cardiocondyla obscurior]|uniref:Ribosomal protein L20 n=1 Tax=Cardiocondyla obscurior TaxID=286306 RepID=A0AAW2GHD2_9HYME
MSEKGKSREIKTQLFAIVATRRTHRRVRSVKGTKANSRLFRRNAVSSVLLRFFIFRAKTKPRLARIRLFEFLPYEYSHLALLCVNARSNFQFRFSLTTVDVFNLPLRRARNPPSIVPLRHTWKRASAYVRACGCRR